MLNTTIVNGAEVMEIFGFAFIGGNWIPLAFNPTNVSKNIQNLSKVHWVAG
jgi:hypothetical protein